MEAGVSVVTALNEAPSRTLHSAQLIKSSPLSSSLRTMLETRELGRRFDTVPMDVASIEDRLPQLTCPEGDVLFLASDHSLADLSLSIDGLLQHRKRLLAPTIDRNRPRRNVLVIGAGPAGLMAAIQMALRNHHVVICEQRDVYARNRYIGVYKEVTHLMAALGMPERMTYDFSQYRGKRGIMLADIQTLLHVVALKLGVVIYTGATARSLELPALRSGEVELQRATQATGSSSAVGITRWQHDTVARVRSGVAIRFDTILEGSGGRSGLRETLIGAENVVSIHDIGMAAAKRDPSLNSFFEDPEDHCAEYVDSGYGCPPGLRQNFAAALISGSKTEIPDEIPCFVANINASIFTKPMQQTEDSLGLASQIGDRSLDIPHDWVVLECRLADQSLSRYHIEGPLPQTFAFGGKRVSTAEALDGLNPVSLLLRILYAMGVPFDAVDRRQLVDFYTAESSHRDATDIVSTWVGRFRTLRLGGEKPIWYGTVPGAEKIEYGIIGEALQNAWYRFGVGVDDSFTGAGSFAALFDCEPEARLEEARRLERVMTSRSVQVLYHMYAVARNTDQGVVGPVLTEYHMEEQHSEDLAEARLREVGREGAEMLAAASDLDSSGFDELLPAALDYLREGCCRRALTLLDSLSYSRQVLAKARLPMNSGQADWRTQSFAALEVALTAEHRELLSPLFALAGDASGAGDPVLWQERLVELALGRYSWVSPWLRACALRAIDPSAETAIPTLTRAAADPDPLVAESAAAALAGATKTSEAKAATIPERYSTIDKVATLRNVSIFKAIPHEVLVNVATLLTERWAAPDESVIEKGELDDSLYVVASGRVRVHDGDRVFRDLSDGQFFGELSLLDSEPRSASVSAVDRTHLFRLAQDDFYALMTERPEIMRAINHALCEMVRLANALGADAAGIAGRSAS